MGDDDIVTEHSHLQNIHQALTSFKNEMIDLNHKFRQYFFIKDEEIQVSFKQKCDTFWQNEDDRDNRLKAADYEDKDEIQMINFHERERELEEIEEMKSAIREYQEEQEVFLSILSQICNIHGETVAGSLDTITKCIHTLESYLSIAFDTNIVNSTNSPQSISSISNYKHKLIKDYSRNWTKSLSPEECTAIYDFTTTIPPYHININSVLRGVQSSYNEGNERRSELIHSVLSKANLPIDIKVYRGVSYKDLGDFANFTDNELIGCIYYDMGFISTSIKKGASKSFTKDNLLLAIQLPRGTRAAFIGNLSQALHEEEILIDRGQLFRFTDVRYENGYKIIEASLLLKGNPHE